MKSRAAVRFLSVALLLLAPLTTALHTEDLGWAASGLSAQDHQHGPFSPCPEVREQHCLACAAHLFAPAPAVARTAPPQVRRAECVRLDAVASLSSPPEMVGRSPPSRAV